MFAARTACASAVAIPGSHAVLAQAALVMQHLRHITRKWRMAAQCEGSRPESNAMPDTPQRLAPADLALPWRDELRAAAIIELAAVPPTADPPCLPPFPLIGIGAPDDGWAGDVDLVVADHDQAAAIAESCARNPQAAAVLVQLLRLIEALPPQDALVAESLAFGLLQSGAEHQSWLTSRQPVTPEPPGTLHAERSGDRLDLVIDRPHAHGSIDRAMRDALREAFDIGALDGDIRAITLGSTGRTFSTGADLAEFGTTRDPVMAHLIRMQTLPARQLVQCGGKLWVHIQGACVGSGLEMAAFAARITAAPGAWFQLPELKMGLIPGAGGCVSLSRRIGRQHTARLVLSGRRITAQQALAIGLVDHIAAD